MDITIFNVENGINTCYIDSVLMALFYSPSHLDRLLMKDCKNAMGIYLQELISEKFVKCVKNGKTILADDVNLIRALCCEMGWRSGKDDEFIEQQDVTEFFTFLMETFENENIEISRSTLMENKEDIVQKDMLPYLPLALPENETSINVKQMLHNWLYDNIKNVKGNENGLDIYNISNLPYLLALSVNRFTNQGVRIYTDVIIQKKIYPMGKNMIYGNEWQFHSAICHRGETVKSGHYYALLTINEKWYIFDDLTSPCLREVSMADIEVTTMLKKECMFLFYKLI